MPDISKSEWYLSKKVEDGGDSFVALFFVFTGLKTEIGLINDPYLWKVTEP
jgi:Kef-type K+ transport system membrane component KefB